MVSRWTPLVEVLGGNKRVRMVGLEAVGQDGHYLPYLRRQNEILRSVNYGKFRRAGLSSIQWDMPGLRC